MSCSAKDLPQEVKDGLEIIHVGYVTRKHSSLATEADCSPPTGISGRQCATCGLKPTGQARRTSPAWRVDCKR